LGNDAHGLAAAEEAGLFDLTFQRHGKFAVFRPVEDMQVNHLALLGGAPPIGFGDRTRAGAVDGLAVDLHPRADGMERLDCFRRQAAIAFRSDVQQQISAFARRINQIADQRLVRFPIVVVVAVTPGGV